MRAQSKFLSPGEQHPKGLSDEANPYTPWTGKNEKFHKSGSRRANLGQAEQVLKTGQRIYFSILSSFLSHDRGGKTSQLSAKRGPWESFTNFQLSLWHWLLNQSLHPINLLLQILHMKLEKRANGRRMIRGFVVINMEIVRDPNKVREFQCRNFKGE